MAGKTQSSDAPATPAPEPTSAPPPVPDMFVLVGKDGKEFVTRSPVAYHNLRAQGYKPKDAKAAEARRVEAEKLATDPEYARQADPTTYRSGHR